MQAMNPWTERLAAYDRATDRWLPVLTGWFLLTIVGVQFFGPPAPSWFVVFAGAGAVSFVAGAVWWVVLSVLSRRG